LDWHVGMPIETIHSNSVQNQKQVSTPVPQH